MRQISLGWRLSSLPVTKIGPGEIVRHTLVATAHAAGPGLQRSEIRREYACEIMRSCRAVWPLLLVSLVGKVTTGCSTVPECAAPDFDDVTKALATGPAVYALVPVALVGMAMIPFVERDEREIETIRARNEAAWSPPGHAVSPAVAVVAAELRFHLPASARGIPAHRRVTIKRIDGGWLGKKTLEIDVVGDFSPERLQKFLEAVERLHGHLEPAPHFRIRVLNDAATELQVVGVFEYR